MKKMIAVCLALVLTLSFVGCGKQADVTTTGQEVNVPGEGGNLIGEDVTKIEIDYSIGSHYEHWTVEGEELNRIRDWANGLRYEVHVYEEGRSPGDYFGGYSYRFYFPEGQGQDFAIVNGYLVIGETWYVVNNPSEPPV